MSYVLEFSGTALEDIEKHKKSGDKALIKKVEKIFKLFLMHKEKILHHTHPVGTVGYGVVNIKTVLKH